jgi:hypothetical protein
MSLAAGDLPGLRLAAPILACELRLFGSAEPDQPASKPAQPDLQSGELQEMAGGSHPASLAGPYRTGDGMVHELRDPAWFRKCRSSLLAEQEPAPALCGTAHSCHGRPSEMSLHGSQLGRVGRGDSQGPCAPERLHRLSEAGGSSFFLGPHPALGKGPDDSRHDPGGRS